MRLTSEAMRSLYQCRGSGTVAGRADCLSEDNIARAAAGDLNQAARELIADHLTLCSDCAQEYRLLHRMKPLIERAFVLPLKRGSVIEGARVRQPRPGAPRRFLGVFSSGIAACAVVTVFLVIGLACAALMMSLRRQNAELAAQLKERMSRRDRETQSVAEANRQLAEAMLLADRRQQEITEVRRSMEDLSRPQLNAPIIDLDMQNDRSAADSAGRTVTVPDGVTLFTVILHVDSGPSYPEYALEILDGQGRRLRRVRGLYRNPEDTFIVALSRRLLPAGRYRLRLHGLYAGGSKAIGDYRIRVRYQ